HRAPPATCHAPRARTRPVRHSSLPKPVTVLGHHGGHLRVRQQPADLPTRPVHPGPGLGLHPDHLTASASSPAGSAAPPADPGPPARRGRAPVRTQPIHLAGGPAGASEEISTVRRFTRTARTGNIPFWNHWHAVCACTPEHAPTP